MLSKSIIKKPDHVHGFSLAEVLITLSVLGVIFALTIPNLANNEKTQKRIAEAKLRKFNNTMQGALRIESARLGKSASRWEPNPNCGKTRAECLEDYWNEHFASTVKSKITKKDPDNVHLFIAFDDGTGVNAYISKTYVHFFFCLDYKDCKSEYYDGRKSYLFTLAYGKFMTGLGETHKRMSREELLKACKDSSETYDKETDTYRDANKNIHRHACTALIERDGWTIKDDYPWRT